MKKYINKTSKILEFFLSNILQHIKYGSLKVVIGKNNYYFKGKEIGPKAKIIVKDTSALKDITFKGGIGLAEAYINNKIETPDLNNLLEMAAMNLSINQPFKHIPNPLNFYYKLLHRLNKNTINKSKKNIERHYDIGNNFYKLWLDKKTLAYSSGIFEKGEIINNLDATPDNSVSLEDAQIRKWDRLIEIAGINSNHLVLEIGCGWGGFANYLANKVGCKVVGITNSKAMYKGAKSLTKNNNLTNLVDIRLDDYRNITGKYDRIISIEMLEAVGESYWPTFFNKLRDIIKDKGKIVIQTIIINDNLFYKYRKRSDFIRKYIFPGGMLPSMEILNNVTKKCNLEIKKSINFGKHYARTLELWQDNFNLMLSEVKKIGFDEKFIRMWNYYFSYCRAGFLVGQIDDTQIEIDIKK